MAGVGLQRHGRKKNNDYLTRPGVPVIHVASHDAGHLIQAFGFPRADLTVTSHHWLSIDTR